MKVRLVTGYVPIRNHPRTPEEYGKLGELLSGVPVPKKAYYDQVQNLWMTKYIKKLPFLPRASQGDNDTKNTIAYHSVNHEKTTWLVQAFNDYPDTDIYVWVDYGIFRLPGVNNQAIYEFCEKLDDKAIYIPGCWDKGVVESANPCWRFCGSMFAVPRKHVNEFDFACRSTARQHISSTKNVEWEVNTWARVEAAKGIKLPIKWYKADHNVSMFNNLELA